MDRVDLVGIGGDGRGHDAVQPVSHSSGVSQKGGSYNIGAMLLIAAEKNPIMPASAEKYWER